MADNKKPTHTATVYGEGFQQTVPTNGVEGCTAAMNEVAQKRNQDTSMICAVGGPQSLDVVANGTCDVDTGPLQRVGLAEQKPPVCRTNTFKPGS
jgi:hypothetical protein